MYENNVQLLDRMDFLKQFPDKYFDLFCDDPPYFSGPERRGYYGNRYSTRGIERVDYAKTDTWEVPDAEYFQEVFRVSKNQIIWGVNYYDFLFPSAGRIIWDKCNGDVSFSDCEIAYTSFHNSVRMFRYMWNGMMQGKSITEGHVMQGNKKLNEKRIHPTQKPLALYHWTFKTYCKTGDRIGCGHTGSGSDRIAAHDLGLHYYGAEKSKVHFRNQNERYDNHLSKPKLFTAHQLNA